MMLSEHSWISDLILPLMMCLAANGRGFSAAGAKAGSAAHAAPAATDHR